LAAHLIWFRHYSTESAIECLTRWAMNSRHQSKDIQQDLARGTHQVEKQIINMCSWYAAKKQKQKLPPNCLGVSEGQYFVRPELEALAPLIQSLPESEQVNQAKFLLHLLGYAKQHGKPSEDKSGYEVSVAINAVVRKWPGCWGKNNYKIRMDRAKEAGLLTMIKEKWQRPGGKGRARTYRLAVPVIERQDSPIGYAAALAELTTTPMSPEDPGLPVIIDESTPRSPGHDGYPEYPGNPLDKTDRGPGPEPLHPGGSGGRLGKGTPECYQQWYPPEGLPDPPDGKLSTIPSSAVYTKTAGGREREDPSGSRPRPGHLIRDSTESADHSPFPGRSSLLRIPVDPVQRPQLRARFSDRSIRKFAQETPKFIRSYISSFIESERKFYDSG
jgi:hypothetical protein